MGVEDLGSFIAADTVGRPLGVAGLEEVALQPPDEDGLRIPNIEEFMLEDEAICLDVAIVPRF